MLSKIAFLPKRVAALVAAKWTLLLVNGSYLQQKRRSEWSSSAKTWSLLHQPVLYSLLKQRKITKNRSKQFDLHVSEGGPSFETDIRTACRGKVFHSDESSSRVSSSYPFAQRRSGIVCSRKVSRNFAFHVRLSYSILSVLLSPRLHWRSSCCCSV